MFKIAIINSKDLIKYCIVLFVIIFIFLGLTKFFYSFKNMETNFMDCDSNKEVEEESGGLFDYDFTGCLETSSAIVKNIKKSKSSNSNYEKRNFYEDILNSQIISIGKFQKRDVKNENIVEQPQENINKTEEANLTLAEEKLETEVITQNPLKNTFNTEFENVKIKNETSYELNNDIMKPDIVLENKNIIIFHTHTCESYTSSNEFSYTPTGNFRTTDLNYSVARVGDELEKYLRQYGYNIIHNKDYHDYPSYNGSYTNSLTTVEGILKNQKSDIIFDIHRDAIGSRSDYAPCVKIGNDICAQIMFVIGTNEGGLWHPNWQQNLKFAIKVQQKAEELYPGLFKPIMLTKYRYNQHVGKFASIIEVGATGNTLEQCNHSMKYFAKVLDEVLK